jgi:hypothetical protein
MSFRFVTGDNQGVIYAVAENGDMLFYQDLARNGAPGWAFGGAGQVIGSGNWHNHRHVFAGGDGIIYAIAQNGDLYFYRDLARNGTSNWAFGGAGQVIGTGWGGFVDVFSGGDGVIYAIAQNGDLYFYRDLARNGTANWANGGTGKVIGTGWHSFIHVFGGDNGIIYAVTPGGDLLFYQDLARNGTPNWAFGGSGQVIGGSQWNVYAEVFSGGQGIIYAITPDGFLLYYRDLAQNGASSWAFGGVGQEIGNGWLMQGQTSAALEGYCTPLSAAPGQTIELKVSASAAYQVTVLRLKRQPDGTVGIPMGPPVSLGANPQAVPPNAWQNGCGWATTLSLTIPTGWPSGLYSAQCTAPGSPPFHVVFAVKPAATRRPFAVLANTNTWNAYNGWGGRSKYSSPPGATLSFLRPNPAASPVDDGIINHLTRAELWMLAWMEDEGYPADVYTDLDFHNGITGLAGYKALLVTTHPEYWTLQMLNNLAAFIQGGGRVLYLGGNGMFEEVSFTGGGTALTLLNGDPNTNRAVCYFRNLNPPRPEREILGVAYRYDNYLTFAPFQVLNAGHRFFAGTGLANGALIGASGINGGGASGWEMDTSIAGTAPPGVVVGGGSAADDRGAPPANLQLLARGTNVSGGHAYGADMTYYDAPNGRWVFSAGSITFCGSLVQDAHLQAILRNILNECLAS